MQGLQNLGATCAVNSLLQIICRTNHLRDTILLEDIPNGTLTAELKEILDLMYNKNHSLSPKKFVKNLYQHFDGIFRLGEQLDIGELWTFLFDKINTEIAIPNIYNDKYIDNHVLDNELLDDLIYKHNKNCNLSRCKDLVNKCNETMIKINNNKTSKWLESSQGIMLNIIHCKKCNKQLHNFEPFTSIPIDIIEDNEIHSITDMLRNFLKSQEQNGDWKCEVCNENTEYVKIVKLWKMPPVLIFIIKRFINIHQKNMKPISINKNICIKAGSVISNITKDIKYNCSSMALHFGGIMGGHYCAICDIGDKFVLYDDINMTILNEEQINNIFENNKDAYMIVYSMC